MARRLVPARRAATEAARALPPASCVRARATPGCSAATREASPAAGLWACNPEAEALLGGVGGVVFAASRMPLPSVSRRTHAGCADAAARSVERAAALRRDAVSDEAVGIARAGSGLRALSRYYQPAACRGAFQALGVRAAAELGDYARVLRYAAAVGPPCNDSLTCVLRICCNLAFGDMWRRAGDDAPSDGDEETCGGGPLAASDVPVAAWEEQDVVHSVASAIGPPDVDALASIGRWGEELVASLLRQALPGSLITWENEEVEMGRPWDVSVCTANAA